MNQLARIAIGVIFTVCGSLSASTISYNLVYSDVASGASFGSGQITIDSSALTANNFDLTNVPTSFISSLSLTFSNFPNNGPITFGLTNLGAAFLNTDGLGNIIDLNLWSYDRIGLGTNTCPPCTVPYLAGINVFTATVTDPVHNNTSITYHINLIPTATPEPTTILLTILGACGLMVCQWKQMIRG